MTESNSAHQHSNNTAVELSAMKQQLEHVVASIDELKQVITSLTTRNDKITELLIHKDQQSREINTLWQKYDALKQAKETDHEEFKAFINKQTGAQKLLHLFLVAFGFAASAAIGWVFHEVTTASTMLSVHTYQLEQLAKEYRK